MEKKLIKKSIDISATKEKVWEVLLDDGYTRQWYSEFSEGSHALTDWKQGSKVIFTDHSGRGLVSQVAVNRPFELLSVEHRGVIDNGTEDFNGEDAREWQGLTESYSLEEHNGSTRLSITHEIAAKYYASFEQMWDKALSKIKKLSES